MIRAHYRDMVHSSHTGTFVTYYIVPCQWLQLIKQSYKCSLTQHANTHHKPALANYSTRHISIQRYPF